MCTADSPRKVLGQSEAQVGVHVLYTQSMSITDINTAFQDLRKIEDLIKFTIASSTGEGKTFIVASLPENSTIGASKSWICTLYSLCLFRKPLCNTFLTFIFHLTTPTASTFLARSRCTKSSNDCNILSFTVLHTFCTNSTSSAFSKMKSRSRSP